MIKNIHMYTKVSSAPKDGTSWLENCTLSKLCHGFVLQESSLSEK